MPKPVKKLTLKKAVKTKPVLKSKKPLKKKLVLKKSSFRVMSPRDKLVKTVADILDKQAIRCWDLPKFPEFLKGSQVKVTDLSPEILSDAQEYNDRKLRELILKFGANKKPMEQSLPKDLQEQIDAERQEKARKTAKAEAKASKHSTEFSGEREQKPRAEPAGPKRPRKLLLRKSASSKGTKESEKAGSEKPLSRRDQAAKAFGKGPFNRKQFWKSLEKR